MSDIYGCSSVILMSNQPCLVTVVTLVTVWVYCIVAVIYNKLCSSIPCLQRYKIGDEMGSNFEFFDPKKDQWNSWSGRFGQWLILSPHSKGENATTMM